MICGYRGTGKKTLYKVINGQSNVGWKVYSKFKSFRVQPSQRYELSATLRQGIHDKYELNVISAEILDENKDNLLVEGATLRTYYNRAIERYTESDKAYRCRHIEPLSAKSIITDWLYADEAEYFLSRGVKVLTCRVFRSEVPIPAESDKQEHSLDDYVTHYLMLGCESDFAEALGRFPQYKDYQYVMDI